MAKNLKAIKCPQCGSVEKEDLGDEKYICQNCGTEYYLDDDYTHIVHHHQNQNEPTSTHPLVENDKVKYYVIGATLLFFIFLLILKSQPTRKKHSPDSAAKIELEDERMAIAKNNNGKLISAVVGIQRTGKRPDTKRKLVAYIYDDKSKLLKTRNLNTNVNKPNSIPIDVHYMSNGDTYVLYNQKVLLKLDPDALSLDELGDQFYKDYPELASGISKIEMISDQDAFKILSQEGKSYILLPVIQQIIPAEMEYKTKTPPDAKETTYYEFCNSDVAKLMKYIQKHSPGYLRDIPYFDCDETDIASSEPELRFNGKSLVSYQTLTDRIFYNAKILGYDDELVVISTTLDASDETPPKIQALDPKNGKVLWTYEYNEEWIGAPFPEKAIQNKTQTLVSSRKRSVTLDKKTGKKIGEVKM